MKKYNNTHLLYIEHKNHSTNSDRGITILQDFIIPFIAIAAAELGDKTQISIFLLSSKTSKHLQILLGVMLAFIIVDGIAIVAGSWITTLIPIQYIKLGSGLVFIIFGIIMILNKKEENEDTTMSRSPFISSFLLIFLSEWGDKTQIAAALFATKYNTYFVFFGAIAALAFLSILAIFFGKIVSEKIPKKTINTVAAILFIIMGISFILL